MATNDELGGYGPVAELAKTFAKGRDFGELALKRYNESGLPGWVSGWVHDEHFKNHNPDEIVVFSGEGSDRSLLNHTGLVYLGGVVTPTNGFNENQSYNLEVLSIGGPTHEVLLQYQPPKEGNQHLRVTDIMLKNFNGLMGSELWDNDTSILDLTSANYLYCSTKLWASESPILAPFPNCSKLEGLSEPYQDIEFLDTKRGFRGVQFFLQELYQVRPDKGPSKLMLPAEF